MKRLSAIGLCSAIAALASSEAHADPWITSGATVRGDFDGDGVAELVVSSPESDDREGIVYVIDVAAETVTAWTRDTSGLVGGGAATGDYFGAALAVGDFDDDGYDDLVVGAPGADDSGDTDGGAIHIIYGSATGLTTTGDQIFHQDTTGIEGVAEDDERFGDVLATGDFNCDGYDDAVIGIPHERRGLDTEAGAAQVLYGTSGGITTHDNVYYQGSFGVDGTLEAGDHFGGAVVAGNFNGDASSGIACDDLAVAAPDEDSGSVTSTGWVYTILGGAFGLSTTGDLSWDQDSSGVEDTAEASDRFGLRLYSGDTDDDGYDELAVVVPGDSCIVGHGEAVHLFHGSSSGITLTGDEIECHNYRCDIHGTAGFYACHTESPTIHASSGADSVHMFHSNDVAHGNAGNDKLAGGHGDDVVFGGAGNDTIRNGPGLDVAIGGAGDDTFVVSLDCQVAAGEVIDGGPGSDTVQSHRTQSQLIALGLTFHSIETFSIVPQGTGDCSFFPAEEGPWRRPRVAMSWEDLPNPSSVFRTTSSTLDLAIVNNNIDTQTLTVDLTFWLTVQGFTVKLTDSIPLAHQGSTVYPLDIEDFIPGGVDPEDVPEDWLELPTSARLVATAEVLISGEPHGGASAPRVYGHLEDVGTELVVYRDEALEGTYYHGDLDTWRWGGPLPSAGSGHVFQGFLVASPTPP